MKLNSKPPRFIINPLAIKKSKLFPTNLRSVVTEYAAPSYLGSLWLGVWTPVVCLCVGIWAFAVSLFNFRFMAALSDLMLTPVLMLLLAGKGLAGRLWALPLPDHVLNSALVLSPTDAIQLTEPHARQVVIDADALA